MEGYLKFSFCVWLWYIPPLFLLHKELDFSLLSAISYLGLVFLYKSNLRRGAVEFDEREERCVIGEDEAIWAEICPPHINEVLIKIKALFSIDPSTTLKLAVLLFVTARYGGSLIFWTLAKMVFFLECSPSQKSYPHTLFS